MDGPYFIPTRSVRSVLDPFADDPWGVGPINPQEVASAIKHGRYELRPNTLKTRQDPIPYDDVARIAYFVLNPPEDPLLLEVNSECGEDISIADGCHRLASAIYAQRPYLLVEYGGYCDGFARRFPKRRLPSLPFRQRINSRHEN